MFLHPFDNICLWTYVHRETIWYPSRPIENQYVLSEKRNAQILIDSFGYDAKYITKKYYNYMFTISCVSENNKIIK